MTILIRMFIIATRHGTTPMTTYAASKEGPLTKESVAESLIVFAWVNTVPNLLLREINKAMKKLGITEQYFTFKTMTPIYPDLLEKL